MKIKTIVLGDRTVGKTTLLSHLDSRLKTDKYVPTLGVDFVSYSKSGTKLHLWDTSGSDRFSVVIRPFIRDISLAILVYNSERSFRKIEKYIDWVDTLCAKDYRIVLVSNCADIDLECSGQYLACEKKITFFACNALDRTSCLTFWHELMHYCNVEVKLNAWQVSVVKKRESPKEERNSYRLCWWM